MSDNKIMNHLDRYRSDLREFKTTADVAEDKELMDSVFKALKELEEELSEASITYRKCEERVQQEINSLVV